MKIRTDFVTNSSSSSYITIRINNPTILNQLIGTGLEEFIVHEDSDFNHFCTPELIEFDEKYLKSIDVVKCLQNYMKDKYDVELTRNDFTQIETTDCYGEAASQYSDEFGITFDSVSEMSSITSENFIYLDEEEIEIEFIERSVSDQTIEFGGRGLVKECFLKSKDSICHNINNFVSKYGSNCLGYAQLVTAYIRALAEDGKSLEEITETMENITNRAQIEKVISDKKALISYN